MFRKILWLIFPCFFFFTGIVTADDAEKERRSIVGSEKWLSIVDEGRYSESWVESAGYLKKSVTREQWEQLLQAARKPLGKLVSRNIRTKSYQTSLPGVPDGEYMIIQFETVFRNKQSATETVTTMLDKDGKWRVAGYFIN